MSSKLSSYQKLKRKNEKLRQEIRALIEKPDSSEALAIRSRHTLRYDMENAIMFGFQNNTEDSHGFYKRTKISS